MRAIQQLERGGYTLQVNERDGIVVVEANRTPATVMSPQLAAPMLLELNRRQDDALSYMRAALYGRINGGNDDAITIAEFRLATGHMTTSDGLKWGDVLREQRAALAKQSQTQMRRAA